MDTTDARAIAQPLAQKIGASSEDEWAIWAALTAFPSTASGFWLPRDSSTVHWLDNRALIQATAATEASLDIRARPTVGDQWIIEVGFQSASLDDAGFRSPGLRSNWHFRFPAGDTFDIEGETLVSRDSSSPNSAETLARDIAVTMLTA